MPEKSKCTTQNFWKEKTPKKTQTKNKQWKFGTKIKWNLGKNTDFKGRIFGVSCAVEVLGGLFVIASGIVVSDGGFVTLLLSIQ